MSRHAPVLFLALVILTACTPHQPEARLAATVADSAGVSVITVGVPLADVALGRAGSPNGSARRLYTLDSLTHPIAVAFRANGETAVLDSRDLTLSLVDSIGELRTTLGRRGDGPGELGRPVGVAALSRELIVLQSYQINTLARLAEGEPSDGFGPPIAGDWAEWMWQLPDIGLEFPSQSAPEIWSRRIRALDDSTFLVMVGPPATDTGTAARALLLHFDRALALRDTVAVLPAIHQRRGLVGDDPRRAPVNTREVWSTAPVWSASDGWVALGSSDRPSIEIRNEEGLVKSVVRWPAGAGRVLPEDRMALGDHIVRVTLASSPSATRNAASLSESERETQVTAFMATFPLAERRPEVTGLFLADRCLWVAGFDATDAPEGTAREWLVIDLAHPASAPRIITIGAPFERVVAIDQGKAATIWMDGEGQRHVGVYRVPTCGGGA